MKKSKNSKKNIENRTVKVDKNGFVVLSDFDGLLPTERVSYYEATANKDGTVDLKFYDKNMKMVKPYAST